MNINQDIDMRNTTPMPLTLLHWRYHQDEQGLVWLCFDKKDSQTNTLCSLALNELSHALQEISHLRPRGLIIFSSKAQFIAGADLGTLTRFSRIEEVMAYIDLGWKTFAQLAALPFPTTAMIHGFCIGGGLELALACRYRVALDDLHTRLTFPEVMLGLVPAWHGMQWLPRLIGPLAAFQLMLTGRTINAKRAKQLGLVDQLAPQRVLENTARQLTLRAPTRKCRPFVQRLLLGPLRWFVTARARHQISSRGSRAQYPAPYAILDLWQRHDGNALRAPATASYSVQSLFDHPTTKNLLRIYFLQERLKDLAKSTPSQVKHVHIIGAGVMGGEIAALCALRGHRVTLQDTAPERIAPAITQAAQIFKQRLGNPLAERAVLDRLIPDPSGSGIARADIIIEAIIENLAAKRTLFGQLEKIARPNAILATNTSSLRLRDIAALLPQPTRLIGLHFFNPVFQMQLVEVVTQLNTDPALSAQAMAFVHTLEKLPLPVSDAPGFLVNRVLGPYLQQAFILLDKGFSPETLDTAMVQFGMPMGPIELADTVGLDICLSAGMRLVDNAPGQAIPRIPRKLAEQVALGRLGKKTGRGFYLYVNDKPQKTRAHFVPQGLAESMLEPYFNQVRAVLQEGVIADRDLLDAGLIFGTGFAPFRGGPVRYLEQLDAKRQ